MSNVNDVYQEVSFNDANLENIGEQYEEKYSQFKVSNSSNLPAKQTAFSRLKSVLFYEIKVQLTPYEQKIEDEINEFLHQEITWQSVKNFLFKEIEITHRGKRIL